MYGKYLLGLRVFVIVGVISAIIFVPWYLNRGIHEFDAANINGRIKRVESLYKGRTLLVMENDSKEYGTYFHKNEVLNNDQALQYLADAGDSAFKPPHTDTLYLYKKNGGKYRYTFAR